MDLEQGMAEVWVVTELTAAVIVVDLVLVHFLEDL